MITPKLIISTYVSLTYELKKMERYLRVNLLGPGHRLMKNNLPGLGLTKLKKHWARVAIILLQIILIQMSHVRIFLRYRRTLLYEYE